MIYKQLYLENYRSFNNITFDLTSTKNNPKNIAVIYGPNGSGKSTLLEAFTTLYNLMQTLNISKTLNALQEKFSSNNDYDIEDIQALSNIISHYMTSTAVIYNQIHGTFKRKPTILKLSFQHNNFNGSYEIQLYKNEIIYEELNYVLSKNQSCFFKLDKNSNYINQNIFKTKNEYSIISELFSQSWGKHSLLSLLYNELNKYNASYIEKSYSKPFISLLEGFNKISYRICNYSNTIEHLDTNKKYLLRNISAGNIQKTTSEELKKMEVALLPFLQIIIDDLISIKYIIEENQYTLILNKTINNKKISIPFYNESSGIKELVNIIPYIIDALNGNIVILDEYANHIHDSISYHLIRGIAPLITGQLILSTHSTVLLSNCDEDLINNFYFIEVNNSTRDINCISDIEIRTRANYNYQKKYLFDDLYKNYRNKISPIKQLYADSINNNLIQMSDYEND
jgi:hypothetical protein